MCGVYTACRNGRTNKYRLYDALRAEKAAGEVLVEHQVAVTPADTHRARGSPAKEPNAGGPGATRRVTALAPCPAGWRRAQ